MIEKIFLFFRDVCYIAAGFCFIACILCVIVPTPKEALEICFGGFLSTGLIGLLLNYIYENI